MERRIFSSMAFVVAIMCYLIIVSKGVLLKIHAIESPQYTVIHSESEFEVRLYRECSWMSAQVRGTTSFQKSTKDGFHRLYQYIHGSNSNSSRIPMSSPVLTTNIASSSSSPSIHVSEYHMIRLYLSNRSAPQPLPELSLELEKWKSRCMAVRKFSGFAEDDNVGREVETLMTSLNKHVKTTPFQVDKSSYTIAQYNSSRHLSRRLNEVWLNVVSGFSAEGCLNN